MTQTELAESAEMKQSRISAMERPGEAQFNLETLVRLAAAFRVGLKVEFVPFSEMMDWENGFSQDQFDPTPIDRDIRFLHPSGIVNLDAGTMSISHGVFADIATVNFACGTYAVPTGPEERWNLPLSSSPQAESVLAPVDLVAAAAASNIYLYCGADRDAN